MVLGWDEAESLRFMRARCALGWSDTSITSERVTCKSWLEERKRDTWRRR
jgi:hypothetical protein